ncbi:MAG: methyl-accepting chemotaxis protein, partial [Treponema sp.]|nr:methyl-accepting chemotaxis protein [Treponema sp.]
AGESGKGFAVVADEIRKLAESSSVQAQNVAGALKKMQQSLAKINVSTGIVIENFTAIDEAVQTVAAQEKNIQEAMKKQEAGSRSLTRVTETLTSSAQDVKTGSAGILEESRKVMDGGKSLEAATGRIRNGMDGIVGGMGRIGAAIAQIQEITLSNKKSIDTLAEDIAKFKIG